MLNKATSRYKIEVSLSERGTVRGIRVMSSNIQLPWPEEDLGIDADVNLDEACLFCKQRRRV